MDYMFTHTREGQHFSWSCLLQINDWHEWKLNPHIFTTLCLGHLPLICLPLGLTSRLLHSVLGSRILRLNTPMLFPWTGQTLICLTFSPPFSLIARCLQKLHTEQAWGWMVVPLWPSQPWMGMLLRLLIDYLRLITIRRNVITRPSTTGPQPIMSPHEAHGMTFVRETLQKQGVSVATTVIILASWRPGPERQYRPHVQRWSRFWGRWNVNPTTPTISNKFFDWNLLQGCGLWVCQHGKRYPVFSRHCGGWLQGREPPLGNQIHERCLQP